jgi:glycosidase
MQWDGGNNAGFTSGKPWLGINANYKYINYESQKNNPSSVLNFYKALIALRQKSDCLKHGEFTPLYSDNCVMCYQRRLGDEVYTVALNFSFRKKKLPEKIALQGSLVISNTDKSELDGFLLPWEGVLVGK